MTAPRFFTDEDVYGATAKGLRTAGFNAISTPESDRLGESDESQLAWATAQGRAFVTFNVAHFAALHRGWLQQEDITPGSSCHINGRCAICYGVY